MLEIIFLTISWLSKPITTSHVPESLSCHPSILHMSFSYVFTPILPCTSYSQFSPQMLLFLNLFARTFKNQISSLINPFISSNSSIIISSTFYTLTFSPCNPKRYYHPFSWSTSRLLVNITVTLHSTLFFSISLITISHKHDKLLNQMDTVTKE